MQYSDLVMDVYAGAAGKLGPALGVADHMHRVFAGGWGVSSERLMACGLPDAA